MAGIDIGAIMEAVGAILVDALVNALTNTLTQLITGAISSIADSVAESVSGLQGPLGFIGDAISTFAHNLAAELNEATATLLNAVNAWAHDTIPILKNQQDLSNLIVGEVAEQVDALKQYLGFQVEQQYKAGAAFTDYLLNVVMRSTKEKIELGRNLWEFLPQYQTWEIEHMKDFAEITEHWVTQWILEDLKRIERMPEEDLKAAAAYLSETVDQHWSEITQWFRQVVVAPISMANAFRSAFTEGLQMTPDEYAQQILEHQEAYDIAMAEYAKRMEERLQKEGIILK